jgi:hypothetical protein
VENDGFHGISFENRRTASAVPPCVSHSHHG